jgi:hypothetical protein
LTARISSDIFAQNAASLATLASRRKKGLQQSSRFGGENSGGEGNLMI